MTAKVTRPHSTCDLSPGRLICKYPYMRSIHGFMKISIMHFFARNILAQHIAVREMYEMGHCSMQSISNNVPSIMLVVRKITTFQGSILNLIHPTFDFMIAVLFTNAIVISFIHYKTIHKATLN